MKAALLVFVLGSFSLTSVLGSVPAFGQADPTAQAEQMTRQSLHEMAEQQRQLDEFDKQTAQNSQNFMNTLNNATSGDNSGPEIPTANLPKFSVKAGKLAPGTKVSISCPTPNAVIYYNTTGWTPTTSSRRYTGPITVYATTLLQAFAAAPNLANSPLVSASYTVKAAAVPVFPLSLSADGVLHAMSRLHLVTNSAISSKNAKVGDKISIQLDQDVKVGDAIVIPKGTPIDASITLVKPSGHVGVPGYMAFAVHSLTAEGKTISLQGGERLDGINHTTRSVLLWVTFVGSIPAVMMKGGDADIKPGMKFTVGVVADTPLKLLNVSDSDAPQTPSSRPLLQ
jgi:hypothetical protein